MNKPLKLFIFAVLHLALLWGWVALLDDKRGPLPPLGRFLSPFEGFWQNAEPLKPAGGQEVILEGLAATVVAEYDHRAVPHLFAPDLQTLFFAQGYVTARDRLWQMDIQSRAGLGRLSEILGPSMLRFDQERRRMGMPASARASLEIMLRDSLTRVALEGYAEGVNAFISSLKKAAYPLEFKLLGYAPEPWSPLKSVVLLKNMQWVLTRDREDVGLARVADSLGAGFFSRYYPSRHPGAEPVFPREVLPVPVGEDTAAQGVAGAEHAGDWPRHTGGFAEGGEAWGAAEGRMAGGARGRAGGRFPDHPGHLAARPDPSSGSNNFVIAGSRTRARSPLLANDPHLDLTLPSLWYEIQLKSGDLNAYGVSLPGLPGIAIGFTPSTAWGFTNGMNDVFDWHELRFRNDSLNQYLWRGRWRETRRVIDTIPVRGRASVVDTQLWTHAGPVPVYGRPSERDGRDGSVNLFGDDVPPLHALQWTALHPSNELGAFLRLLTARNVPAFRRALRSLETPTLNVAFATRGDIALMHQGRVPVKRAGQGRLPTRGNVSSTEWRFYLPAAELPASVNPARGWLASANQELTDADDSRFFGAGFYPPERSQRLHRLLVNEREATLSSAWDVMRDDYSRLAARAVPRLLRFLPEARDTLEEGHAPGATVDPGVPSPDSTVAEAGTAAMPPSDTARDARTRRAIDLLRAWDYRHAPSATAPSLFAEWWKRFHDLTWRDELRGDTTTYIMPSRSMTLSLLLSDSLAAPFDDVRTPDRESAGDLARLAFTQALDALEALNAGAKHEGEEVAWGRYRPVSIPHLLRLGPLGVTDLETGGCEDCVNAQKKSHGPSWRMAVQTGKRPEAWGIYPGGQSGNPGSPRYDAFVADWAEGRSYRLLFLKWPLEMPDSTAYILALKGKR